MTLLVNMRKRSLSLRDRFNFFLIFLLAIPLVVSIIRPGTFPVHDDFSPIRVLEIDKCVEDGQLPCRWSPDLGFGYGYPEFNYYAPLPYYVMEVFHLFGAGYLDSVKIFIVLITFASAIGMFIFASRLWGDMGGIISTILYLYLPYRAIDMYVRGDIGELVVLSILPFLFWAVREVVVNKKRKIILLTISLAILFTSHNIGIVIVAPALFLWFLAIGKFKKFPLFFSGVAWAFAISSFFLIPAWFEKNLVHIDTLISGYFNYLAHFLSLKQILLSMHWGYGVSQLGSNDDINLSIGIVQWVLPAFGLLFVIVNFFKRKFLEFNFQFLVLVLMGVFSLFLTHGKSTFIWNNVSIMKFIQFPWRFLILAGFCFSAAGGYLFKFLEDKKYVSIFIVLIFAIAYVLYGGFFRPKSWEFITDSQKFSGENWTKEITASIYDYLPVSAKRAPDFEAKSEPVFVKGIGRIIKGTKGTNWQDWRVNIDSKIANLQLQIYGFPKWRVIIDGKEMAIDSANLNGLITVQVPLGTHTVSSRLMDTPIRTISNIVSLGAFVAFLVLCIKRYYY